MKGGTMAYINKAGETVIYDYSVYAKKYYEKNKEQIHKQRKQYRDEHKEEAAAYIKQYYEENKEQMLQYKKDYFIKNKERITKRQRAKYEKDKQNPLIMKQKRDYARVYCQKSRLEIYRLEGNKCICCGEDDPIYFQIDHVNDDGWVERKRKRLGNGGSPQVTLSKYLKEPDRYQLLCANCNWAKRLNGELYKPKKKKG